MNNSFLIRMSAIAVALPLVALTSGAAAGRIPRPLGAGEQPLSAGVHVLDLVSREQGRPGYKHLPRIALTLPSGWFNFNGWAVNNGGALGLAFWDVNKVYPTGCRWQGKPMIDPGRTVGGLARVLATRPLRHASGPRNTELAGFGGKYLDGPCRAVSASNAAIRATLRAGRGGAGRPTAGSKAPARSTGSGSST